MLLAASRPRWDVNLYKYKSKAHWYLYLYKDEIEERAAGRLAKSPPRADVVGSGPGHVGEWRDRYRV